MFERAAKLCQRKIYSWLNSKCGLPICIVGLLVAVISAFQFGEVFLEWSKERYAARFTVYGDNIAGRSYEKYMCPQLPIDIVYTWVNGSDPQLLRELRAVKKELERQANATAVNATAPTNSSSAAHSNTAIACPFQSCVPWNSLILDARNLSHPITVETVRTFSPCLSSALECQYINSTGHVTPVYAVRVPREEEVAGCLKSGITDEEGRSIPATRGFLTSDGSLAGVVQMSGFALVQSAGIRPLNSSKLIRKWMDLQFGRNVTEVDTVGNTTAVARFRSRILEQILKLNSSYQFSGRPLSIRQANLVWMPFSLPSNTSESQQSNGDDVMGNENDVISASRFQDNEELRYSLRSVERHAPWVRHIFIVTNGQIPSWLNLDNPRLTLISHEDIFPNKSHLPTYSSPAIESHLHRIPGLSKFFIYLNDDVMFGDSVWPEDFYTPQRGQKVFLAWSVPHCAEGCPPNWITDHYCDQACNNSACDWDGGDCVNASRPGWQQGVQGWHQQANQDSDYCNSGCLNSWLGDRYCDASCRVPDCGYDAGDCGTDNWDELYSVHLKEGRGNHTIPLGTTAMFFNLTELFFNGTITSAKLIPCKLIRTAVVAQKYKTLSLTFAKHVNRSSTNFTIAGTVGNGTKLVVTFSITGDTATKNTSLMKHINYTHWSFPDFSNTHSQEFLKAVSMRIQNANRSINYWVTERPEHSFTPPPPTSLTNYTVANASSLPENVSQALKEVDREYREGELTEKGYLKRRGQLLEPFRHLLAVSANGSVHFGANAAGDTEVGVAVGVANQKEENIDGGGANGNHKQNGAAADGHRPPHVELFTDKGGGHVGRRLMTVGSEGVEGRGAEGRGVSEEDLALVGWVANDKRKELTREQDLRRAIEKWEEKFGHWDPAHSHWETRRRLPWEKIHVFAEEPSSNQEPTLDSDPYSTAPHRGRRLLDTFGDSLRHVNRLYNKLYGFHPRKVPAHMPHMINRDIMTELQNTFPEEFDRTSSHKVRSNEDMQFAFSYFYFLMGERRQMVVEEAFAELDTDGSGILSVRELRTLLARVSTLPLDLQTVHQFEELLRECGQHFNGTQPSVDPVEFETHYDPNLPLVTVEFTHHCKPLLEKLNASFKAEPKHKFEEIEDHAVAFKMINENASKIMQSLDEIRKEKKKFVCLNDNIDHRKEGAELAKLILLDFYESLYPIPSQFELGHQYRNRFLHIRDLNEWLVFRNRVQLVLHLACAVLLVLCVISLFYGKLVQCKRRVVRALASYFYGDRTRPPSV